MFTLGCIYANLAIEPAQLLKSGVTACIPKTHSNLIIWGPFSVRCVKCIAPLEARVAVKVAEPAGLHSYPVRVVGPEVPFRQRTFTPYICRVAVDPFAEFVVDINVEDVPDGCFVHSVGDRGYWRPVLCIPRQGLAGRATLPAAIAHQLAPAEIARPMLVVHGDLATIVLAERL